MNKKSLIINIALVVLVCLVFISLISISPYPAGDDPGLHTTVLKYVIQEESTDFTLPFFPQVQTPFGQDRFVTNIFLASLSKITGLNNVFILTIYFAAFCLSISLIFIYLIIELLTKSKALSFLGVLFLGFTKWYQEGFWEGNYDQYTGLLLLSAFLYFFYLWHQKKKKSNFVLSFLILILLYKAHQLGFLIGFIIFVIILFKYLYQKLKPIYFYPLTIGGIISFTALYLITKPGYFAPSLTGHHLTFLLSPGEGVPLVMFYLFILGLFYFIFIKKDFFLFTWFSVAFIFSQSFLLDLAFYPFRFNLYLLAASAVIYSLGLELIFKTLKKAKANKLIVCLIFLSIALFSIFQYQHVKALGQWITGQEKNPASVILEEDVAAFEWLKNNTSSESVALAPYKWGYYLPAIAERGVVLDEAIGGDERDNRWEIAQKGRKIFTTEDSSEASNLAKEIKIDYIIWDASISRFPERYPEYTIEKLKDTNKFLKVYDQDKVVIYKVL